ncbi:ATP-grasp fold amidoligase family protein [Halobacillus kuroshimensis]|uniref:ATP-grasp fold amidoligase family protein n=1 Tax=Halobacillus kuroshimensis TaxID=302481 RepID=UPI0003FE1B41|nr:ATP-grasp fold amidoligase family protein [Halobacillus kuroshimensis]
MDKTLKNIVLTPMNFLYKINPKIGLKTLYFMKYFSKLNIDNPKTYNEKLNWMKINYRNELMPLCADKYTVRQYVKEKGCGEILTKLLWEGFNAEDIPFENLPQKFVIKVTHGSGNNIICKNKNELDKNRTIKRLNQWLKQKYLPCYGEWFYGIIKPRIIVEEFISDDHLNIPVDYKVFCFNSVEGINGAPVTVIDTDRFTTHKRKVYDDTWQELRNIRINFPLDEEKEFKKPDQYEEMLNYAKILSEPFPHARVDFYIMNERLYFGEITFMSDAGFGNISPKSFNEKMGQWIKLPD